MSASSVIFELRTLSYLARAGTVVSTKQALDSNFRPTDDSGTLQTRNSKIFLSASQFHINFTCPRLLFKHPKNIPDRTVRVSLEQSGLTFAGSFAFPARARGGTSRSLEAVPSQLCYSFSLKNLAPEKPGNL